MARSRIRQNVVKHIELQPRSGERSYDNLFFGLRCNSTHSLRLRKYWPRL